MKRTVTLLLVLVVGNVSGQNPGPDLICGNITQIQSWGAVGGVRAYTLGFEACNIGSQPVSWVANTPAHPVMASNMYRHHAGRFEQIGMSWLKHGFFALSQSGCSPCTGPGGAALPPGCSTVNGVSAAGSQASLGPRSEVNAATGAFPFPFANIPVGDLTERRIRVATTDLDTTAFPGGSWLVEVQYVAADDAAAGNDDNNASWRPVNVVNTGIGPQVALAGMTTRERAAIHAWSAYDSDVSYTNVDVPGDGRFIAAFRASFSGGLWHWELAVQNLNSHRSAESISMSIPAGATVSNVGFHDVDHHSGDGLVPGTSFDGTDWSSVTTPASVSWATTPHAIDPNANALRWGTLFNFRFDCDQPPPVTGVPVTLGLFRPGTAGSPTTVSFTVGAHQVEWIPNDGTAVVSFVGELPNLPLVIAFDAPQPAPVATPWGLVHTSALNPGPNFIALDAYGIFGPADPLVTTDASGAFSMSFGGLGALAGSGAIAVSQTYALMGPNVIISNPVTTVF